MQTFEKQALELKIYGTDVKLNRPTFGQAKEWGKKIKNAGDDGLEVAGEMLTSCGMPAEVLDKLEIDHFRCIQDLLLGEKKT